MRPTPLLATTVLLLAAHVAGCADESTELSASELVFASGGAREAGANRGSVFVGAISPDGERFTLLHLSDGYNPNSLTASHRWYPNVLHESETERGAAFSVHAAGPDEAFFTVGSRPVISHLLPGDGSYSLRLTIPGVDPAIEEIPTPVAVSLLGHREHVYAWGTDGADVVLYRVEPDRVVELRRDPDPGVDPLYGVDPTGLVTWRTAVDLAQVVAPDGSVVRHDVVPFRSHVVRDTPDGRVEAWIERGMDGAERLRVETAAGVFDAEPDAHAVGILDGDASSAIDWVSTDEDAAGTRLCVRRFAATHSTVLGCVEEAGPVEAVVVHGRSVLYALPAGDRRVVRELWVG